MRIIFDEEQNISSDMLELMQRAGNLALAHENITTQTYDGFDEIEISLSIVSQDEIRCINRDFREKDAVTDVLSFPQYSCLEDLIEELTEAEFEISLGDVVICEEQAKLQAEEYGHSFKREMIYLFVHSMFHLLGYDHMEENEKSDMRQAEEAVMSQLGLVR